MIAAATGLISKEAAVAIESWVHRTANGEQDPVVTVTVVALGLFFSVGMIITGLVLVAFIVVVIIPLYAVVGFIEIMSRVSILAAGLTAVLGLTALGFYYRWLSRKV